MTLCRQIVARAARHLAVASLASLALAPVAGAQHVVAPAGVSTVAAPPAASDAGARAAVRVEDRGDRVFDHTVNGALVGLAAGALYALVLTSNSSDDSEDGLAYLVLVPLGTVLGAAVGTVVGLVRTQ